MNKIVSALVLAGMVSAPGVVMAEETSPHTVTGNLSFVTDYRYRGVSQTDEGMAIQGGFDYAHSSGFYLGTWASNVEASFLNGANIEMDFYGGYAFNLGDVAVNVGGLYYAYPGQVGGPGTVDIDTFELYAGATWKWLNVKYSHATTDFFGIPDSDGSYYLETNVSVPLPMDISLALHYGYQKVEGVVGDDDIGDWKIGLSKSILGFNMGLAYVDTDVDNIDLADDTVVFSVGKTF